MNKVSHTIYLLRHGEVEGPAAVYGRTDVPLSQRGWEQLTRQGERLEGLSQIFSSPLQRCLGFATKLSKARNIPLCKVDNLKECDFGKWDGVPFDDMPKEAWGEMDAFWQSPATCQFEEGEHLGDMHQRVAGAWDDIVGQLAKTSAPQTVLVVAHGGVIRLILAYLLNLDWCNPAIFSQWQIDYASLSKVTLPHYDGAKAKLDFVALPPQWQD